MSPYCYNCLAKFRRGTLDTECPACGGEIRQCRNMKIRAAIVTRLARQRGLKPPRVKKWYHQYLKTAKWKAIRSRILERDHGVCQACGRAATDVHHLSYGPEVLAGMDDSKLVSLCRGCHKLRHPDKHNVRQSKRRPKLPSIQGESTDRNFGQCGTGVPAESRSGR